MKSRWYELKEQAIASRRQGFSIGKIENSLGVPRSTLSGWFKNVELNKKQKEKILKEWKKTLAESRKKAVIWHNTQKRKRIKEAEKSAEKTLADIDTNNHVVLELSLAILYLGEGSKRNTETAIGSSDPKILKFFLAILKKLYNIDITRVNCELSLRADQNPLKIKRYWAKTLGLSISNFKQTNIDKRTKGVATYPYYKGVCNLRCGNVAIQRKLIFLANSFCEKIISENLGV